MCAGLARGFLFIFVLLILMLYGVKLAQGAVRLERVENDVARAVAGDGEKTPVG